MCNSATSLGSPPSCALAEENGTIPKFACTAEPSKCQAWIVN